MSQDKWIETEIKRLDQRVSSLEKRVIDRLKALEKQHESGKSGDLIPGDVNPKTVVLVAFIVFAGIGLTIAVAASPELLLD